MAYFKMSWLPFLEKFIFLLNAMVLKILLPLFGILDPELPMGSTVTV